jgi:hypothetical protein
MRTNTTIKSNANTATTSFKTILEQMKKLTDGGDIKVANKHWDIYAKANNTSYGDAPVGA